MYIEHSEYLNQSSITFYKSNCKPTGFVQNEMETYLFNGRKTARKEAYITENSAS